MVKKLNLILALFIFGFSIVYAGDTIVHSMTYEGVLDSGEDFSIQFTKKVPTKEPATGYMSTSPTFVVGSLMIRIGDSEVQFPENALNDLSNPILNYAKIYSSNDGEYIFKTHGADGGGAWRAKFTFTKAKLLERVVEANDRRDSPIATKY